MASSKVKEKVYEYGHPSLKPNGLVHTISQELAGMEPDMDEIVNSYKSNPKFKPGRFSGNSLAGELAKYILRQSLESVCGRHEGAIINPPVPNEAGRFLFTPGKYVITVHRKGKKTKDGEYFTHTRYSPLLLVDDLPVVCLIQISRNTKPPRINNRCKQRAYINELLKPLFAAFKTDRAGMILLTPKDMVIDKPDSGQEKFRGNGGLVVPMYATREQYLSEVAELAQRHGL